MARGGGAKMCEARKFVFVVFAFLILTALASVSAAKTIYVPDDYLTIQSAVNAASPGDTIIVRNGLYKEHVIVNKQLTIKSERGHVNCVVNGEGSDVFALYADGIRIEGFTITGGRRGIYILSNNNTIINNNISSNNEDGIYIPLSNNNIISNNIISNNDDGIFLWYSNNNCISENNISSNNGDGIVLEYSNNNSISENIVSSNRYGIYLWYSNKTMIRKSKFINDGLFVDDSYGNIVEDNKVNGKPLVYLEGESDEFIDNAGQVILVKCKNITIMNSELTNTDIGIELFESDNCLISNNNIGSNYWHGIFLWYSNNNSISENIISSNNYGIYLWYSNKTMIRKNEFINNGLFVDDSYGNIVEDNKVNGKPLVYLESESDRIIDNAGQVILVKCKNITIMNSELTNTDVGIELWQSDNCLISNNNISSNNRYGIFLYDLNNNYISNNNISSNNYDGILLWNSNNNSISKNNISSNNDNGIELSDSNNSNISKNNISSNNGNGIELSDSNNSNISKNNISSNNGNGIALSFSNNNGISNNSVSSNWNGILFYCSNNNSILNNGISSNDDYGIFLEGSNNNNISNNIISLNNLSGIILDCSDNNIVYLNDFINNTKNACSYYSTNILNSKEPITYTYRGSEITNYMGNYWDDYNGSDTNGDGIGETPYIIEGDKDYYPLMKPFENYIIAPEVAIFDTGTPSNPYPSIAGTHNGTITPNQTIIATKLYTYPCAGTGGHTEYARIWNKTWNATATWEGYASDWHNITFDKTVVLLPNETYNYTIRTGSYPQIHHTDALPTKNGWINCSEFVDANGKVYYDWIPAIKLS